MHRGEQEGAGDQAGAQEGGEILPAGSGPQYSGGGGGGAAKQGGKRGEGPPCLGETSSCLSTLLTGAQLRQLGVRGCLMFIHVPFAHCLSASVTVPGALCGHSPFFNFLCLHLVPGQAPCACSHQLIYKLYMNICIMSYSLRSTFDIHYSV